VKCCEGSEGLDDIDALLEETNAEETNSEPEEQEDVSRTQEDDTNIILLRTNCTATQWDEHKKKANKFLKNVIIESNEDGNALSKMWLYELYKAATFECLPRDVFTQLVHEKYQAAPTTADRDYRVTPKTDPQTKKIFPLLIEYPPVKIIRRSFLSSRVTCFPRMKIKTNIKSLNDVLTTEDRFNLFNNKMKTLLTSEYVLAPSNQQKRLRCSGMPKKIELSINKELRKGMDLIQTDEAITFLFPVMGLAYNQLKVSFPNEITLRVERQNGKTLVERKFSDSKKLIKGIPSTACYLEFEPKDIPLPFPVEQADPEYKENYKLYSNGLLMVQLTAKKDDIHVEHEDLITFDENDFNFK